MVGRDLKQPNWRLKISHLPLDNSFTLVGMMEIIYLNHFFVYFGLNYFQMDWA